MKNAREAKEFLASQIVLEAQRENVVLSEVERKMLYFSETGWSLPEMVAVSDEFDEEYDQGKYEKKITRLIRGAYKLACKGASETCEEWWACIRVLDKDDHYLSVMIRMAGLRPRHDQLKLLLTALVVAPLFATLIILLSSKYGGRPGPSRGSLVRTSVAEYVWAAAVCAFIAYQLLRFVIGAKKTDDLTAKALRALGRVGNRIK